MTRTQPIPRPPLVNYRTRQRWPMTLGLGFVAILLLGAVGGESTGGAGGGAEPTIVWPTSDAPINQGLFGEYYHDNNLTDLAFTRIDADFNFDWFVSAPRGLASDTFSIRWTGYITAPTTGAYTFHTWADDASRLYINDALMIDTWSRSPCCRDVTSAPIDLEAGVPTMIRMEYAEDTGTAYHEVRWSGPGFTEQDLPPTVLSSSGLMGTYYDDLDMTQPVMRRVEAVDHDWGQGGPDPLVGEDVFSARWSGFVVPPETGTYTFSARSDDGARIKIAGDIVLNDWQGDGPDAAFSSPVHMVADEPTKIDVEYFEDLGNASIQVGWTKPSGLVEVIPVEALLPDLRLEGPRVAQFVQNHYNGCALFPSGATECWGTGWRDYSGLDAVQVAVGSGHACVLLTGGNVDCWGSDYFGQAFDIHSGDAVQVATGDYHTCILRVNGSVDCHGRNVVGEAEDYHGDDALQISTANSRTCVLLASHNVHCWGYNPSESTMDYLGRDAAQVATGGERTCVVRTNGNVYCWGTDMVGNPEGYAGTDAISVAVSYSHTCALLRTGDVECWGYDIYGEAADYRNGDAVGVSVGYGNTCIVRESGTVHCWGRDSGQYNLNALQSTPMIADQQPLHVETTGPEGARTAFPFPESDASVACTPASGSIFAVGTSQVTCTATDRWGNEAKVYFAVRVVPDTTPPTTTLEGDGPPGDNGWFRGPVNVTLPCADLGWGCASTHHRIDGAAWQAGVPPTITRQGTTQVEFYSEDLTGNVEPIRTQFVRIDSEPPVIPPHRDEVREAIGPNGSPVGYVPPIWRDAVAGFGLSDCTPRSHSTFPLGDTTVACTARDPAGNEATPTTFMVSVLDTTPPVIEPKRGIRQHATAFGGANISYEAPRWTDLVDGTGIADCTPAHGTFQPIGDTTITCGTKDRAGNEAERTTFNVTVVPGPVYDVAITPANLTVNLAQPGSFAAKGYDRYGNLNDTVPPQWSTDNGTIDANGTYIGEHVGFWHVNATMDDANDSVRVFVTDKLRVAAQMEQSHVDPLAALQDGIQGTVEVRLWDHTPQANATVDIVIRQVLAGIGVRDTTERVTTDAGGTAEFRVPEQFATAGSYEVHAHATWRGNQGGAVTGYDVGA